MRAARRSVVAAVASRDDARSRAYAAEWRIPVAHGSYAALLRDPTIDAVYIPLPNALHVEWTLRAIDAGKHVLCEKPMALAAEEVDRIASLSRARNRVVAEAFMYRHEPLTARLLTLVRGGAVGRIQRVDAGFTFRRGREDDPRLDPTLGGGSLWDVGCYAVDITRLITGEEPFELFGFADRGATGIDESFTGVMRFPGGFVATIHSSFRAAPRTWLEVAGDHGVLRAVRPFKPAPQHEITIERENGVERVEVAGSPLLFVRQVEAFVAAALDGVDSAVSLAHSRGNAAALAALYRAAESGHPQRL